MRFRTDNYFRIPLLRFRLAGVMMFLFLAASIVPVGAQEVNLALNKPITPHTNTAPAIGGAVYHPDHVVDGDPNAVWYSWQGVYTEIAFTVDLTFAASLERYQFLPRQLTTYRIETSTDGIEWVERASGSIGYLVTATQLVTGLSPHRARYVRFTGSNNQNAYAGLAEFEAFGSVVAAIDLPRTGQTRCYAAAGGEIACAGTGQDGEIQAGVTWPEPRFTDNGDGTLTDHLTGLVWLKNADCYDRLEWAVALSNADILQNGFCGLADNSFPGDWRLPNVLELESLVHFDYHRQFSDPNMLTSNALWLNSQGFTSAQSSDYWTSTTAPNHADQAYYVYMDSGYTHFDVKSGSAYFMAVRGRSDGPAALWRTGQTIVRATGDDGDLQNGVPWPAPRFIDHNDGTVTDQLTGLTWLKNANCAGSPRGWDAALSDVVQLNATGTMNAQACGDTSNNGSHQTDWRLPNIKELRSLNDFSAYNPTVAVGHPFTNLRTDYYHLSSSHSSRGTTAAWVVAMVDGYTNLMPKDPGFGTYYVWPVRGGILPAEPPPFPGGEGTPDDPYQIATAEQLDAVRDYLDKHFILTADIVLTDEWEPIGTYVSWENPLNSPFTGSLNGAGFSIRGLLINRSFDLGQDGVGLFGLTDGATIENLNLVDVDITGRTAGALIGWAFATTVENVTTSGGVTALTRAGGLMGEVFENSIISDSSSSCTVSTTNGTNAGGLVGQMRGTTINRSHATGDVSTGSQDLAGGLVGEATSGSFINECSAAGKVTGTHEIGGLVGYLRDSRIENSHATGRVDGGTTERIGGLVGHIYSNALVSDSFARGEVVGGSKVGGLVGEIDDATSSVINSYSTGTVTGAFNDIGGLVGRSYGLVSKSFATGAVMGNGTVGGLVGDLFNPGASILDSYATGVVNGNSYVGGLVGDAYQSAISGSYAVGSVSGTSNVGGLVGNASGAAIGSSYWAIDTSGQDSSSGGQGSTFTAMQVRATFTGWNFDTTWNMIEGSTTPYLLWQKYFDFSGTKVQFSENEGDIQAGHVVMPDSEAPQTRVQSTVANESTTSIEGLQGRWMAVTRAGSSEVRAVAATDAEGESRTWFDIYNAQTEAWERASSTLALEVDAFDAGNEIVIEEDDADGLQIRIETQVTRELHF